ncbi:dihydrodipicolinate reductase-like protein CRR1, chloroplastic [Vicia villosa]|uniref:dihydrodipicolinate reductase-like protein CRR1, chloroplastic n=1 Tax=Vicia villosa TaxID=3911 RepID=UPI00273ABC12|nr:dihydrodipicolinate reductase-like protein CRR1, chloroplastic [Vicia villosa]
MSAYEDDMTHKATTFGMKSVIYVPQIKSDTVAALSAFCDKATMGVLVAPTLSIGSILLQQAAISASFHYRNVEIVESKDNANVIVCLGEIYNREEDSSTDVLARGQVLGDGIRVHSLVLPELPSSITVHFSSLGEIYTIKHDITDVQCLMRGLLLAIRKVVRLKLPQLFQVLHSLELLQTMPPKKSKKKNISTQHNMKKSLNL